MKAPFPLSSHFLLKQLLPWLYALWALPVAHAADIEFLDLRSATFGETARLLTGLTGKTVIASAEVRDTTVDGYFESADLQQLLTILCRSAGLVYRYDDSTDTYTILSLEAYQRSQRLSNQGRFETRTYKVDSANLNQIASALSQLYTGQIILQGGEPVEDFRIAPGESSGGSRVGGRRTDRDRIGEYGGRRLLDYYGSDGRYGWDPRYSSSFADPRYGVLPTIGQGGFSDARGNRLTSESALRLERAQHANDGDLDADSVIREMAATQDPSIFVALNYEHSLLSVRTADMETLSEIEDLIKELNRPVPQVILELKILQLDVTDGFTAAASIEARSNTEVFGTSDRDPVTGSPTGVDFLGNRNRLGLGNFGTESGATFAYEYLSSQVQARLELLATDNRVEVIATPVLVATNNRDARIEVGEERIITIGATVDSVVSSVTGVVNERVRAVTERRIIGVTLDLIPRINDDGTVTLSVFQESTTLKPRNNTIPIGDTTILVDSIDTANVDATVVAANGATIAIGGLIRSESADNQQKVPLLGDVPVLGSLFRRDNRTQRKTEIILLVTPYILPPGNNGTATSRELMERLSDHPYHLGGDGTVDRHNQNLHRYRESERTAPVTDPGTPRTPYWENLDGTRYPLPPAQPER
jgi:type II secretory pathway component GspD/PulD (secretin)